MTPEILSKKLLASCESIAWPSSIVADFISCQFRGRDDPATVSLPDSAIGLRLGAYPVLVAPIDLDSREEAQDSLRALHNQMIIARSYMRAEEVVNSHIMLCATATDTHADWRGIIDLVERDETVCRKVVWLPAGESTDDSYNEFLARTFLAQPWRSLDKVLDAPLDHNQELVERILVRHGLTVAAAKRWVLLAEMYKSDPDALIPQLVAAREHVE